METMWHPDIPLEYRNQIVTGDARELAKAIPDESVDLVFTDPVYDRIDDYKWLAETAARALKPEGWCISFYYTGNLPEVSAAMSVLKYEWQVIWHRNNEVKYRYAPVGKSIYIPALVHSRGNARRNEFAFDLLSLPVFQESSNHAWSKPTRLISYYIAALSVDRAIVFDPFVGGGAVPAACKRLGRNFIAFEIDPETAERARAHIAATNPPLFVLAPQQLPLAFAPASMI